MTSNRLSVLATTAAAAMSTLLGACASGPDTTVPDMLASRPDQFAAVRRQAETFRLQLLISEVVPGKDGTARLRRHTYRTDAEYFYPASSIKLCAAVAAVQMIEAIDNGMTLDTPLVISPLHPGEPAQQADPSNLDDGAFTVGHEIRKLFLVSDNEAFNRLYDLVGHEGLNLAMTNGAGLSSVVINHRLSSARSAEDNLRTPRVELVGVGEIEPRISTLGPLTNKCARGLSVGDGYIAGGEVRTSPMDFTHRNGVSLRDLQDLLVMVVRPDIDIGKPSLSLSTEHREFLLQAMSMYPRDCTNPRYSAAEFPDDYGKFLLPGLERVCVRSDLRIYNKVGQAYGFTVENAYIVNAQTDREVFVTAVIYTNRDGILNDDRYEYESIALPFMADLGEAVARRFLAGPHRAGQLPHGDQGGPPRLHAEDVAGADR